MLLPVINQHAVNRTVLAMHVVQHHRAVQSAGIAVDDFLRNVQQQTIQDWFTEALMPKLTPVLKTSLKKQFQREYADNLVHAVRKAAVQRANKDADSFIAKLAKTDDLANYLKAVQLL